MDLNPIIAIFRFTVLEIFRTRLWLFAIAVVLICAGVAIFSASLAITESFEYRVVSYATLIRLLAVFVVALFVSSSVIREFDDGTLDLIISKPVSRFSWYSGKLAGYFCVVTLLALICGAPLILFKAQQLFSWWFSFVAELYILAAAALAFAVTLRSTTITVTALLAFYALSRIISALVLMSTRAANEIAQPVNLFVAQAIRGLAYLLPDLSRFTSVPLLIEERIPVANHDLSISSDTLYIGSQLLIYTVLLSCVGLFDLYRRNL